MLEEWPEPSAHHGAPLHHQQLSGGTEQSQQPDVQDSFPDQTPTSAHEEGRRRSFINRAVAPQPAHGLWHT